MEIRSCPLSWGAEKGVNDCLTDSCELFVAGNCSINTIALALVDLVGRQLSALDPEPTEQIKQKDAGKTEAPPELDVQDNVSTPVNEEDSGATTKVPNKPNGSEASE